MTAFLEKIIAYDADNDPYEIDIRDAATALQCATNTTDIAALKTNYVYKSALFYNLDNTGVTDCSSILSTITDNIGFPTGTYLIDDDCTVNVQLIIPDGAILNITAGHTLTINGQILAGRYQIFDGLGSVVVNEGAQEFGYPEWFNDDLVKCYAAFRYIKLARRVYTVDGNLVLDKTNTKIEGVCYPTNINGDCSILNFTSNGRIVIGRNDTVNIADFPRNITLSKLFVIGSNSNLDCISVYGVVRALIEQVYIWTQTAFSGIAFYRAIASICRDVYVQSVGITGTFMGYRFVDEIGSTAPGARPASVWLNNCTYADTNPQNGSTFGFHIGKHLSDIYLDNCEVAEANIGICFDSLEDALSVDFLINSCDFDSCRANAIQIYNCSKGMISFNNCYAANKDSASGQITAQIINSACQVVLNGLQIILTRNGTNAITADANSCILLDGVNILNNDGISGTTAISTSAANVKGSYIYNGAITTM